MTPTRVVAKTNMGWVTKYVLHHDYWHREDGPAVVHEYDNGEIFEEQWWMNDYPHRYGGPSRINYNRGFRKYYYHVLGKDITAIVEGWLEERSYEWDTMSDIEKWELDLFMRSLG